MILLRLGGRIGVLHVDMFGVGRIQYNNIEIEIDGIYTEIYV
jgi:hypothetical protein